MLPFERLRHLARDSADDRTLAREAAECFVAFSDDPVQLVLVCRRLLAHHPANGPLWWLCAHVVGAADPGAAAVDVMRRMARDRTADRLASVLPFPHDDPIAVLGWPDVTGAALAQRPDLDVVVVRPDRDGTVARRLRSVERPVRVVDLTEAMALGASHLLVEVRATSPTTALVPTGLADLRWSVPAELWVVASVDRILPARLFEVMRAHAEAEEEPVEVLELADAARIAGPGGLDSAERFATRLDCPLAPELLRP